jgi:hypothetical protein
MKTKKSAGKPSSPAACSALANALGKIANDLVAAGMGSVSLGDISKHILKLKPNAAADLRRKENDGHEEKQG